MKVLLTPEACRAARALLGWSLDTLASEVDMTRDTLSRYERDPRSTMRPGNVAKIIDAFARHGVEVLPPPRAGARLGGTVES